MMELYVDIERDFGAFKLSVQLEAHAGILGLLGASGSGKSLTLKCIAGIERPDRGIIRLDGKTLLDSKRRIDLPPQRREVGYLFQNYALFPHMTVAENILAGLHRVKERGERMRRLSAMVELLQLQGLERLRPHQLSGGQAQRVALARILATEPKLLLLDEPFSALDGHLRDRLQPELRGLLTRLGQQTLLVTHSRDEAYRMCERLCILDAGRVIRAGETARVFDDPGTIAAARLTGCKNIAAVRRAGEYRVEVPEWGIALETDRPVPETLKGIGIRAHAFQPTEAGYPVQCREAIAEPFEWSVLFRFPDQAAESPDLWWRVPKNRFPEALPTRLAVPPDRILFLMEGEDIPC